MFTIKLPENQFEGYSRTTTISHYQNPHGQDVFILKRAVIHENYGIEFLAAYIEKEGSWSEISGNFLNDKRANY